MVDMNQWKSICNVDKTMLLESNFKINVIGRNRKLVYGAGINDVDYCTQPKIDGKQVMCPAYRAWKGMLQRAYSKKYHAMYQTYVGVVVCNEWLNLSSFRNWWLANQVDGWQLDKDILSDDGVYSPNGCLFVPAWLNSFTLSNSPARGEFPIGVSFHNRDRIFMARCRNPMACRDEHLGHFDDPYDAHIAWLTRKLALALEMKPKMDDIDLRVYPRVVEIIRSAK